MWRIILFVLAVVPRKGGLVMPFVRPTMTIGLDIGTSGVKALALDEVGNVVAAENASYPLIQVMPGWAEQEPKAWWQATCDVCRRLCTRSELSRCHLAAVSLSGQMHGATLLDAAGRVLRPAITWADGRGQSQLREFSNRIGDSTLVNIAGSTPYSSATLAKLLWLREREPDIVARATHVLLAKDTVRYMLTELGQKAPGFNQELNGPP